ncbi:MULTISPECIES: diacylglycerol/lipid kinase family protein [Sporosarcina]|uniref:diacylglycerol/lipid kinase family protein n=1 Tax=Sporosarcina TaxID=1569 RepID=UPI000694AEF5|nr:MULTISPECIES: diacylglycerol kinase family protein [Sporosarcina]WJY28217.1 diacylglycerol kinase family protein [Sporosarcina sp. 0.2-SM1T-5]
MYAIIANPAAGRGKAANLFQKVHDGLTAARIPCTALLSDSPDAAGSFITGLHDQAPVSMIIVIGGDGTASSVLQLAVRLDIPLAILPAGSGNDSARTFGLTADPGQFLSSILVPSIRRVDLLNVNGRLGLTIAAAGADAEIGRRANQSAYKPVLNRFGLGSLAYLIAALETLIEFRPFSARLTVGDDIHDWQSVWLIAAGNTPTYGGGLRVCPSADPLDGSMAITAAHSARRLTVLFLLLPKLLLGKPIRSRAVTYANGPEAVLTADQDILFLIDGEPQENSVFRLKVEPDALQLVDTRQFL